MLFCHQKVIKKQTGSACNFLQPPIQAYFKINSLIFCCPIFFEEYLNPLVRINKMVNEHTVDYHPSLSKLIQGYTLSYFYRLLRGLSLQNISWIFPKTCISHHGCRKVMVLMLLRLLANTFKKIERVKNLNLFIFTHTTIITPQAEGNYPFQFS